MRLCSSSARWGTHIECLQCICFALYARIHLQSPWVVMQHPHDHCGKQMQPTLVCSLGVVRLLV